VWSGSGEVRLNHVQISGTQDGEHIGTNHHVLTDICLLRVIFPKS
jgi:hypothetical protein